MKTKIIPYRCIILILLILFITCSKESPTESSGPELGVNPTSCDFTKNANLDTLIISNSGSGELSWEIVDKPDWLEVSKSSGKITTGEDNILVTADVSQELGNYSGTISIKSNGGNKSVTVFLEISIWTKMADMPTARFWFHCEAVNGKIYAIGGAQEYPGPVLAAVEEYDPVSDTWTKKQNMPTLMGYTASAVVDGKIYIIDSQMVGVYDPSTDTWDHTKAPMPPARSAASACAVNGIIYMIGGVVVADDLMLNLVEAYDPATDTWSRKTPMRYARHALGTVVVNGKIYAMGSGRGGERVEEYDPATDTWTTKADMPVGNGYFGTGVVDGIIYTMGGGSSPGTPYAQVFAYDPSADTWSEKAAMPTARFALGAGVVIGKIYVIGGSPGWPPTPLSTVEEYDPGLDSSSR